MKKFIKWVFIIGVALLFLPFTIGVLIIWLIVKKVNNKKLKVALISVIGAPMLLLAAATLYAIKNPTPLPTGTPSPAPTVLSATTAPVNSPSPDNSISPTSSTTVKSEVSTIKVTPVPSPTITPTPIPNKTSNPKSSPTTSTTSAATARPVTGGAFACDCSKTCTQISSCTEAQYLLNVCGCRARDNDGDGIACDSSPLNCQH